MKITFSEVGRSKRSWNVSIPSLHFDHLYAAVKTANVLRSNDIDFSLDHDTKTGRIFAGMHPVGSFSYAEDALELN